MSKLKPILIVVLVVVVLLGAIQLLKGVILLSVAAAVVLSALALLIPSKGKFMKKVKFGAFFAVLVSALFSFSVFASNEVPISTGAKGQTYHNVYGSNLSIVLAELGYKAPLLTSKGSLENAERVASGEALLGFAQADAYANYLSANPLAASNIMIVGALGKECAYIAVREGGKINSEDDIGEGTRVAVQHKGSGPAETWKFFQTLEDDYLEASTHWIGGSRSLAALKTDGVDAVLWVTSPKNLNHKLLAAVMAQGSGLKLIPVDDYSLNDKLPNGKQVYTFEDVVVKLGFFDTKIETACTSTLVLASTDISDVLLEDVAGALLMNANRISGQ